MEIYSADTIEYIYIDKDKFYEERDVMFWFDVPKEWAEQWCIKNGFDSLEQFDNEYIWDDSWNMYCAAKENGVVLNVREVENEVVYFSEK